ncbi:MAG TPA: metalloregulator ArsR/SmtB family transcription factor [Polyangiaceae bacterium]|jgi:DNA-binding transcriptional ArsR family regulator|nr:metalloregulator ArsR/SmtB family transcription factor [Polyangiaceae bacterium]
MEDRLARTFEALADPARLAVVRLLRKKPRRSSEIADALALNRPATSKHLEVLRQAGLVEAALLQDDARARVYRLRPERFSEMRGFIDEVEAYWGDELAAFKAHVERRHGARRRH